MAQPERYFIGPNVREKLTEVFTRVGAMPAGSGGQTPGVFLQDIQRPPPPAASGIVEAYFVGGWVKGTVKQIRFASNTAATSTAINLIRTVPVSSGQTARICTVAQRTAPAVSGESYVLLNTEC
jgi:hypothetical protein